jgi:subtilisin family serine protease
VSRDGVVQSASTPTTQTISASGLYNLDRIDQRTLPLSSTYTYALDGTGVVVFHFDTGCRESHQQFTGRATQTFNAIGDGLTDCNGHGTLFFAQKKKKMRVI